MNEKSRNSLFVTEFTIKSNKQWASIKPFQTCCYLILCMLSSQLSATKYWLHSLTKGLENVYSGYVKSLKLSVVLGRQADEICYWNFGINLEYGCSNHCPHERTY